MKKVLFNFSIALLAFSFGVLVYKTTRLEPYPTINPATVRAPLTSGFAFNKWEIDRVEWGINKIEISKSQAPELPLIEKQPDAPELEKESGGWYQVGDFQGMPEVWTILLTREYEKEKNGKPVWLAMILTDNEDSDFSSVSIKTDNNRLIFKTNKVENVEYKFDGVFFKGKKEGKDGEKILRGTLRKFVKGKQVAAVKADYKYYVPRCWH